MAVLDNWDVYSRVFEGGVLRDSAGRMAAFTIGEVIGDTLFVHIEKIDHAVAGAGETVNKMFAARMTARIPRCATSTARRMWAIRGCAPPSSPIIRLCCCRSSMWCVSRAVMT